SLVGWELMTPILRGDAPAVGVDHAVLMSSDRVSLFGDVGVNDEGEIGALVELWSRPIEQTPPTLLRCDPDTVFLAWQHRRGVRIECIDAITGSTRWRSEPFQELFETNPKFEQRLTSQQSHFRTPSNRDVHISETLIASDSGAIAILERSGRIASIDEDTGRVLWAAHTPVTQLFEADAAHGVLLIGGDFAEGRVGDERRERSFYAYEIRTGRELASSKRLPDQADWVRVIDPTRALVHTGHGVHAFDLETGREAWTVNYEHTRSAPAGWVFGDDLYLIDSSRALWHVSLEDGEMSSTPLTTSNQLTSSRQIDLVRLGDRVGVLSSSGVLLLEGDRLVGADGLDPPGGVLPPIPTRDRIIALEMARRQNDDLSPMHMLHVLDVDTVRLVRTNVLTSFWDNPRTAGVINAHLIVSSGPMTFVFDLPPEGPARGD
ncbi:MAG: PQQ-binding-like beta-propeller repeat protein, partial [Phycisphaerales bacterium]